MRGSVRCPAVEINGSAQKAVGAWEPRASGTRSRDGDRFLKHARQVPETRTFIVKLDYQDYSEARASGTRSRDRDRFLKHARQVPETRTEIVQLDYQDYSEARASGT